MVASGGHVPLLPPLGSGTDTIRSIKSASKSVKRLYARLVTWVIGEKINSDQTYLQI